MTKKKKKQTFKEVRTIATMFPKNHNNPIKTIISHWKDGHGTISLEQQYPNAYIEGSVKLLGSFTDTEKQYQAFQKLVDQIHKENTEHIKESEWETENTGVMSFWAAPGVMLCDAKVPSMPVVIKQVDDDYEVTCMIKLTKEQLPKTQCFAVSLDYTNDPTPNIGGGVVSLGFYTWRFEMLDCHITNNDPVTIRGKLKVQYNGEERKGLEYRFARPCRRL